MNTTKTVLITGCSSGYGLETARHFHEKGWNVIATMRTPKHDVLPKSDRLRVLAVVQAIVPRFRERRSGIIVNVTSSVTLTPMPLAAVYTASKVAIEGFTASLALELGAFDVQVKLVEPGYCPNTRFTANGGERMNGLIPKAYEPFAQPIFAAFANPPLLTKESDVAEAVWRAANDTSGTLRYPAGPDAVALAEAQKA